MYSFNEFLKNFSIKERLSPKDKKTYWQGDEITDSHYRCTGLTREAVVWTIKKAWASRFVRTYRDDKGKWWVGEKGSRKGFKTEDAARKHQGKLRVKYGAN